MSQPDLSVVIPVYNEKDNLTELYSRLRESVSKVTENYELIFVNDGSSDGTLTGLQELAHQDSRVHYISFSRNFGHQIAVTAGVDNTRGKAVVIIDGDLQDPPELIPEMYSKYREGYKVVYARRRSRKGESWFKKVTAKLFYRILNRLTSFEIPLDTGDFRLIDRQVVEVLGRMREQNKYLRGQIAWIGFRQTFVEFDRDVRRYGQTGYPLKKMLRFALDGITAFSNTPLKVASWLGFMVSILAFLAIFYAIISKFILGNTISGWTSLIISVLFLGGVQLLSLGIIGEYISRINTDVRQRPLYIIEESDLPPEIPLK